MKIDVREPRNSAELASIYDLRWRALREPWQQPKGSERDGLDGGEGLSWNVAAICCGKVVGTGRLHRCSDREGQIRFMCVDEKFRNKGLATKMLRYLHTKAAELGITTIVANVRQQAKGFYLKHGYAVMGQAHTLFGEVPHVRRVKDLEPGQ